MTGVLVVVGMFLFLCGLAVLAAPFVADGEACMPENGCWNCANMETNGFEDPCRTCAEKFPQLPNWEPTK